MAAGGEPLTDDEFTELFQITWPRLETLPDLDVDQQRVLGIWHDQGLAFASIPAESATDDGLPTTVGFFQPKNGPCGALAALNAVMLRHLLYGREERYTEGEAALQVSEEEMQTYFVAAIANVMMQAAEGDAYRLVTPAVPLSEVTNYAENYGLIAHTFDSKDALKAALAEHIDTLQAPGGLVLVIYSVVLTRGVDRVRRDINDTENLTTLVLDRFGLCSQNLTELMAYGIATDNIDPMRRLLDPNPDDEPIPTPKNVDVGFLTFEEADSTVYGGMGFTVGESLKTPRYPVWVVHGGDHFTTMFALTPSALADDIDEPIEFYLYNGLPPAGPRVAKFTVVCEDEAAGGDEAGDASGTAKRNVSMIIRKREVEVDGEFFTEFECALDKPGAAPPVRGVTAAAATAADDDDGKCRGGCGFYGTEEFNGLCSTCFRDKPELAVVDPSAAAGGGGADSTLDEPMLPDGMCRGRCGFHGTEDYRGYCSKCYRERMADGRLQEFVAEGEEVGPVEVTPDMELVPGEEWRCRDCVIQQHYMMNAADNPVCANCGKDVSACRRTVWLRYDDLPKMGRAEVDIRYMPKILSCLRTRWKKARVDFLNTRPPTI